MKTNRCLPTQLFLALSLFLLFSSSVEAETTECTVITSLPYTINTQGIYCLKGNLSTNITSGAAIAINTNNVVIDLNGYKIGGLAAGPGTNATGIYADQRQNITIRNGTVRGFRWGIGLTDVSPYTTSQGHIIEDIRADMNTYNGFTIIGRGNIVRNNQVVDTGGSSASADAIGISVWGPGNRVINNDVYETKENAAGGYAHGIDAFSAPGVVIANNRVGNDAKGLGTSYGIQLDNQSTKTMVKDNTITVMNYGLYYTGGSSGLYMNNLSSGCTTAFSGGTAAGSTNYSIL